MEGEPRDEVDSLLIRCGHNNTQLPFRCRWLRGNNFIAYTRCYKCCFAIILSLDDLENNTSRMVSHSSTYFFIFYKPADIIWAVVVLHCQKACSSVSCWLIIKNTCTIMLAHSMVIKVILDQIYVISLVHSE